MIAVGLVAIVVVAVVTTLLLRAASTRSERRSVRAYERALGVLGDVSGRSEHKVRPERPADAVGRAHVRTAEDPERFRPAQNAIREVPPPRVRLEPPVRPGHGLPVFGEETGDEAGAMPPDRRELVRRTRALSPPKRRRHLPAEEPVDAREVPLKEREILDVPSSEETATVPTLATLGEESVLEPPVPFEPTAFVSIEQGLEDPDEALEVASGGTSSSEARDLPRIPVANQERVVRKTAAGAAAAVAVGALAVGGWQLASRGVSSPTSQASSNANTNSNTNTHQHHSSQKTTPTTPVTPSSYDPVSVSSSTVAYAAPSGSYKVTFSATDTSWVGIERSVGGSYLWMTTLQAGQSASFETSGAIVVRLGAPRTTGITINGIGVDLPKGMVQPYDATFTPSTGVSSSA